MSKKEKVLTFLKYSLRSRDIFVENNEMASGENPPYMLIDEKGIETFPGSILLMGQIWDKDGYCVGTRFPSILGTIVEFKNLGQYWDLRLGQHSIQSCPNVLYSWVNAVPRTK